MKNRRINKGINPDDVAAVTALINFPPQRLSRKVFSRGWLAVLRLFPGLNPDETFDRSGRMAYALEEGLPEELGPFHARSGWPVALDDVADEAFLRYDRGELTEEEYYGAHHHHV